MARFRGGHLVYDSPTLQVYFRPNRKGINEYALRSAALRGVLTEIGEAAKNYAEVISPYDPREDERESHDFVEVAHYRDSFDLLPYIERRRGRPPRPRQAVLLINTSSHARYVEFGNGSTEGERVLGKTLDYLQRLRP